MSKSKGPPRKDVAEGLKRMEMERREKLMRDLAAANRKLKKPTS